MQYLGWTKVPCEVIEGLDDKTAYGIVHSDNLQRKNLHPYEEGHAYSLARRDLNMDITSIANLVGTSPNTVRNRLILYKSYCGYIALLPKGENGKIDHLLKNRLIQNLSPSLLNLLSKIQEDELNESVLLVASASCPSELRKAEIKITELAIACELVSKNATATVEQKVITKDDSEETKSQTSFSCPGCRTIYDVKHENKGRSLAVIAMKKGPGEITLLISDISSY